MSSILRAVFLISLATISGGSLRASAREPQSQGVVLFVDFNHAPLEVQAAQEAATRRGDQLLVIPRISPAARAAYDRACSEIPRLERQLVSLGSRNPTNAARFDELERKHEEAREQRSRFQRDHELRLRDIREAVTSIYEAGNRLESVILSGHSSGRSYFGAFGDLNTEDIQEALKAPPGEPSSLQSIYLWGCYTNTVGETLAWRESFPDLRMILGFDGKAPSAELPASYQMLADAMKKEDRIRGVQTARELTRQFRSLRHSPITHASLTVGTCFVSAEDPERIISIHHAESCQRTIETLLIRSEASYGRYKAANRGGGYENPPAKPGEGALRAFYNELQRHYHCVQLLNRKHLFPRREQVLRLIFFENMRQHFNQAYRAEIDALNSWLARQTPPTDLRYPGLPPRPASRADVLEFITALGEYTHDVNPPEDLQRFIRNDLTHSLRSLRCMPLTWVESLRPGEPVRKPSPCAGE